MGSDPTNAAQRRNLALFVSVSLVSGLGSTAMSLVAGIWVMALTGSASLAGLAGLCVYLPTLFGPLIGTVVDRLPRRSLLIRANLLVACLLLLLLAVRSADQVWLLYLVMLAYGVKYVLLAAGEAALLPAALSGEALGKVNGLRMSAQEGTKLVAPLVGAGLFSLAGGPAVAALAATMLVVAAVLYRLIRAADLRLEAAPANLIRQTWDGVRFLAEHAQLRAVVLVGAVAVAMSGVTNAALFAVVDEGLGRPAAFMGVLSSAQGAGSLVGGLLVGRVLTRLREATVGGLGASLFAAGTAARLAGSSPVVVASSFVVGVGLLWALVAAMTAVQRLTPGNLVGRVAATANSLVYGSVALAIPVGAGIIAVADYRILLVAVALGTASGGVWLIRRARRATRPFIDDLRCEAGRGETGRLEPTDPQTADAV